MDQPPLIGITSDHVIQTSHSYYSAGERYINAITQGVKGIPVIIPAVHEQSTLLNQLDGLLITGAYSNLNPEYYQQADQDVNGLKDPSRDAFNLSVIPKAIDLGVPILGICRGIQEMNVALGGTLHQKVHEQPGLNDHREDRSQPMDVQYGPSHSVIIQQGGILSSIVKQHHEILNASTLFNSSNQQLTVNSVHGQGINTLGDHLKIEALAEDGLVEAISVISHPFALAVQWHPEWQFLENPFSILMFREFQNACVSYKQAKMLKKQTACR
ncbi:gamma-glutamyl-gamma-aminobutyrate hydrolase family protein [Litoribacillus peritrichatus]|uniref:Gamma-glutamyl-gamma-aminobutyrate hydrolase family protein n=1 Tax=Litoribacillus peritrichatus TaxID=718191 RepID=A0ABP7MFD7_9GAMM